MIKKTITYEDFDGKSHTETFYFHISKSELTQMEMRETTLDEDGNPQGGMSVRMEQISKSRNGQEIMDAFEEILRASYGVRSEDGKRFVKSEELWNDFRSTNAYEELFMELVTDAEKASDFVNGIMPFQLDGANKKASLQEKMRQLNREQVEGSNEE